MFQDETDSIAETDSDRDRDRDVKSAMEGGNIEREGAINLTHSRPSSVSGVSNSQHNDMEHEVSTFFSRGSDLTTANVCDSFVRPLSNGKTIHKS